MKKRTSVLAGAVSILLSGMCSAAVITINWTDGGPGTGNAVADEAAGVVPSPYVNTITGNGNALNNTNASDLFDDSGAGSGVAVSASSINAGGFTSTATSGYNTEFSNVLMRNYGDTAGGTITFTGLSAWLSATGQTAYEVYYMSDRQVNLYSGSIAIGAEKFFLANGGAGSTQTGPFVLGTSTTLADAQANANTANYVKFSAISGDSFTIDIQRDGGGGFIDVNGIQIVGVPEPSSAALIGLGSLSLLLRRRR
ncbi:PEP-CTERM sorting domain-containing protein [Sulfuriroseicoccus oceanibius]|uniref:PEP-CTERM sorting domain-containing protein n=1 Tax=Sulfuriroseicoccus oceanibius TaxID=2707525 RepID=A0A6B3L4V2_9BACT|nr:PEP-CTERM sorting domain-containing protein [Sulfuriroseicoccus oceanibius]QQL45724.1 PEP-CTERM sorting domain-containing protein [Sulfuriroseicoccus oceanibius]